MLCLSSCNHFYQKRFKLAMMGDHSLRLNCKENCVSILFNRNVFPQDRPVGGLNEQKLKYAHETEHISTLAEVINNVKPTAIIGKILQLFFV